MTPTPEQPVGLPDEAARGEFWKQVAIASVGLAKADVEAAGEGSRKEAGAEARAAAADETKATERPKAEYDTDLEIHKQTMLAILEVTKGSIARSHDTADFVQKVATALAAAYTTLLAVVFSIKDNPLPSRGFIPTLFLGLAAALATAYLAFLTRSQDVQVSMGSGVPRANSVRKVTTFINWTNEAIYRRAHFLRAAVVSLLFGILFLPSAVVTFSRPPAASAVGTASPSPAVADAAAEPTPSWPPPIGPIRAAQLELYKAQLEAHVNSLAEATPAVAPTVEEDDGTDPLMWTLAILAGILVLAFAADWLPDKGRTPGASASPGSTIPGTADVAASRPNAGESVADERPSNERAIVATGYDALVRTFAEWSSSVVDPARDELFPAFVGRLPAGARVLDVGCGSASSWTGELGQRFALTGIDISPGQIEAARRNVPTGTFAVADVTAIDFHAGAFDAVSALYSIGHLPAAEHESVFERLGRWLRPGGLLLASLPADEDPGSTVPWVDGVDMFFASLGVDRYEQILRDQGWNVIHARTAVAIEPDSDARFWWVLATAPAAAVGTEDARIG